jgi:hypothetical protein
LALDQGLPSGLFDHAIARVESCYFIAVIKTKFSLTSNGVEDWAQCRQRDCRIGLLLG